MLSSVRVCEAPATRFHTLADERMMRQSGASDLKGSGVHRARVRDSKTLDIIGHHRRLRLRHRTSRSSPCETASVTGEPVVDVSMLIREPPAEVWDAFVDPDRIRRFWLASSTGRLATGTTVRWAFKVAGAETDVWLKMYLEHRIEGDLMYDKFPDQPYADR